MRNILTLLLLIFSLLYWVQNTESIVCKLTGRVVNGEPLAFADVPIKDFETALPQVLFDITFTDATTKFKNDPEVIFTANDLVLTGRNDKVPSTAMGLHLVP